MALNKTGSSIVLQQRGHSLEYGVITEQPYSRRVAGGEEQQEDQCCTYLYFGSPCVIAYCNETHVIFAFHDNFMKNLQVVKRCGVHDIHQEFAQPRYNAKGGTAP